MTGQHSAAIDDKRRVSLPPKYRLWFPPEESRTGGHLYPAVVLPWFRGGLAIFPEPVWAEIEEDLESLDYTNDERDGAKLICLPRVERLVSDPEARLMLTADHCAWVRIPEGKKAKLTIVGMGKYLQAFNAEEWPEVQKSGTNAVARPGADGVYEDALRDLLRWVREERFEREEREAAAQLAVPAEEPDENGG